MKQEYIPMFSLTKDELEKAKDWMQAHDKEKHIPSGKTFRESGAIGGAFTYCFTPTSIGVACSVKCSCGEEIDVTDYDLW
jgi:hypothetical protein